MTDLDPTIWNNRIVGADAMVLWWSSGALTPCPMTNPLEDGLMIQDYKHPITPPQDLVRKWWESAGKYEEDQWYYEMAIATRAAQWGADQELEACCKWLPKLPPWSGDDLRRHRRPKPPSLKEQALKAAYIELDPEGKNGSLIIRALENLPDHE